MKAAAARQGYAMVLTLLFVVLMLSVYGVAHRQIAAALRVETVRAAQARRDEGTLAALARGLALLETGVPPSDPFTCGVTLNTSVGPRSFTLTFASEGIDHWSVHAAPTAEGADPPAPPSSFGAAE
jgi:hypothetical protein